MGKFITECGKEYDIPKNHQFKTGIILSCLYPPNMSEHNSSIPQKCLDCPSPKKEYSRTYCDMDSPGTFPIKKTVCFAKNVDHKPLPLIDSYSEPCNNTHEKHLIEIVLQAGEYRTYLFEEFNSQGTNAFDFMEDITEILWDKYTNQEEGDEPISIQMLNLETGHAENIEFERIEDLEKTIISLRVVGFTQKIDPPNS